MIANHQPRTAPVKAMRRLARFPGQHSWRLLATACFLAAGVSTGVLAGAKPQVPALNSTVPPDHAVQMAKGLELFKANVRTVLNKQCVSCHGGEKTKSGFDLTTREALLQGGDNGPAVVPGDARASRFYKLVAHLEKPYMPHKTPKLAVKDIANIAAWIDAGAPYDKPLTGEAVANVPPSVIQRGRNFWSFQPLHVETPPQTKSENWCRTPIDRFVLGKMEARKLQPAPVAVRRKLIRRAFFDLIGLPPTPEEVKAFVKDQAPDAYEKLIDRLLASPQYGERWGRHWLDLARFAESHGYEQDYDRPEAYGYRDFVIQALNQDMPYDRFVQWQIAGDELEPDNPLAMMATGYLAAGTHATQITASQVEKERYDELDDMTATVGTSLLGVTVGCARCHDHKFDPVATRDYYRLLSTFTTTVRSVVDLDLHPEHYRQAKSEFDRLHAPLTQALQQFEKNQLPARFDRWLKTAAAPPSPRWMVLEPVSFKSMGGATLTRLDDGSYLAAGTNSASDTYTFVAHTTARNITAVRLEALAHPSMVKGGPGRAANGNFALSDFHCQARPLNGKSPAVEVKLLNPKATFEQKGLPVKAAIDPDKKSGWAIDPQIGKDHAAVFEFEKPLGFEGETVLTFTLDFQTNTGHNIGRPRLALTTMPLPARLDGASAPLRFVLEIQKAIQTSDAQRTPEQRAVLLAYYRKLDPEWKKLNQAVLDHLKQEPKPEMTKVMVASEGLTPIRFHTQGADFFDKTYFLKRGDLSQKQEVVTQAFLQILMKAPDQEKHWQMPPPKGWRTSYRRRALASWITDHQYGAGDLLARVIVNRLWQHLLGRGIVATPSDFGAQGERPTHPELLDWLASELIARGWHMKAIQKLIMTSAVYMQDDALNPTQASLDPDNRFYWRHSRRRLEGETIRDAMLSLSGDFESRMFGPGSLDEGQRRRSIYFTIKRSQMIPLMTLFDAPDTLQSTGLRSSTTTAPQAMAMMNNPHVRRYAHGLAKRLLPRAQASLADAVRSAYVAALGREPAGDELSETLVFVGRQRDIYASAARDTALELALADFCQALMSLNEFVYVE